MNFYLLFVLYCKAFTFGTTLDFNANLHLHRIIASYRTDALFKLHQVSTITCFSFLFLFCMLFVLYCKLITYASLLDSTSTKYYNTSVYFNIFQCFFKLHLSPRLEQFLSCNLQGIIIVISVLVNVNFTITSLKPQL